MTISFQIVSNDILNDALKFAEEISSVSLEGRRTSQRPVKDASKAKALHGSKLCFSVSNITILFDFQSL